MAEISKPDYRYVWSSGGANVAPSNTKIQTGWTSEVPPYQWENFLQNRQDNMLSHINQHGVPQWDALTEYFGTRSYVTGSDGIIYRSVQNSGPNTTTQDPVTDTADNYWRVAFADASENYLTQTTGDARYLRQDQNGSDIDNASTFRSNIGVVPATDTVAGLIEIATQAEVTTGVDSTRALTPFTAEVRIPRKSRCTAWVNFNGLGATPIRDSYNVGSITDNGVGDYIINFSSAMTNTNYAILGTATGDGTATADVVVVPVENTSTTTTFRIRTLRDGSTGADPLAVACSIFGGL